MSSIVMDKETIFTDELIRENARLTVQHEADLLRADQLRSGWRLRRPPRTSSRPWSGPTSLRTSWVASTPCSAGPLMTCILSWRAAMPARCAPASALSARVSASLSGKVRRRRNDPKGAVPALLSQPGD